MNKTLQEPFIKAQNLVKHYPLKAGLFSSVHEKVHAVNGVSLSVGKGETHGLVGESGCGKTTTGRMLLRVIEPDSGEFFFNGSKNIFQMEPEELRSVRSHMQYIFQDPYSSLNPKMQIKDIVTEPLRYDKTGPKQDLDKKAAELLSHVGLSAGDRSKYPHEFSGGQRQRISIARSIAKNPSFIVCDEPVSSLDVSIQSQILNLLIDIQKEFGISYLFIAHNLAVVFYMSDTVSVMYTGFIVESAASKELYTNAYHPYTKLLLRTMPADAEPGNSIGGNVPEKKTQQDSGEVPSLIHMPPGCTFYPRCPIRGPECRETYPPLVEKGPGHWVRCFKA